ncbi:ATP-binding protein [Porphyromonas endodontalis]
MIVGKVISIEYDRFKVRLLNDAKVASISIKGKVYHFGNIGSYLKVSNHANEMILCEVIAIYEQGNTTDSALGQEFHLDSPRDLFMKPIGSYRTDGFKLGIVTYPSVYADVYVVTEADLNEALKDAVQKNSSKGIYLGNSRNLQGYPIYLDIDRLFSIHTAILGNSGSGKSYTIARILQQIEAIGAKHTTILFDVNGEYAQAFPDAKHLRPNVARQIEDGGVKYSPFYLPYYLLTLDEWLAFLMASERTQRPFWDRVLQECYRFYRISLSQEGTGETEKFELYIRWRISQMLAGILSRTDSDTSKITSAQGLLASIQAILTSLKNEQNQLTLENIISTIKEYQGACTIEYGKNENKLSEKIEAQIGKIDFEKIRDVIETRLPHGQYYDYKFLKIAAEMTLIDEEAKGNSRIREYTSTMFSRLDYFLENPECTFMRTDYSEMGNNRDEYLRKIGVANEKLSSKFLLTIELSALGNDILELITGVLTRMIFDYRKERSGEDRRKNPIHLILDEAHRYIRKDKEYILKENLFERVAREGRKYACYLFISSQRPSELSPTVLSQCANYIIHRTQNKIDLDYIYSVLPYFSEDYLVKIKQASAGEALVFGSCVPMPLQVEVIKADPEPNSKNCIISEEWGL